MLGQHKLLTTQEEKVAKTWLTRVEMNSTFPQKYFEHLDPERRAIVDIGF